VDYSFLAQRVMYLIPLILSLTVHEFAHAWSAYKLGDTTAAEQGRLTLNPLVHIDLIGTFLLPLLGVPFGWAKPVPVNPVRFRRDVSMGRGMMITAAAGPLSNVVLAVVCAITLGLLWRFTPDLLERQQAIGSLLFIGLKMNVALALFNMLPIPPLDGSRVVGGLIPDRYRDAWDRFARFGPILLLATLVVGATFISGPIRFASALLFKLVTTLRDVGGT
jgi:Zn-dependent protease